MSNEPLYRAAIGCSAQEYYIEKFLLLEHGLYHKVLWNWAAAIFGPFWISHRRIGHHYSFVLTFIVVFFSFWGGEMFGVGTGVSVGIFFYTLLFPVAANTLYFNVVKGYCSQVGSKTKEDMATVVRARFETVSDKASYLRGRR